MLASGLGLRLVVSLGSDGLTSTPVTASHVGSERLLPGFVWDPTRTSCRGSPGYHSVHGPGLGLWLMHGIWGRIEGGTGGAIGTSWQVGIMAAFGLELVQN